MKIVDLTEKLKTNINDTNYYIFNNSLVHYKDNIFLMTYRTIKYNLEERIHPWSFWWNGYKLLKKCEIEKNKHFDDTFKLYSQSKYRNDLAFDSILTFNDTKTDYIPLNLQEFDSTGLAILEYIDDEFHVKYNINNIFENLMNQDARLAIIDGSIWITYNVFLFNKNDILQVELCKREIFIDLEAKIIFFGKENFLLNHEHKLVEKNCVIHNENVLYEIHDNFTVFTKEKIVDFNNDIIKNFIKNNKNTIFSLSTPVIKYKNNNLMVGHLKLEYKNEQNNYFLNSIDLTKINKHGKYIYFAFFILFDDNYNILKMSDFFIPTIDNCHLPYLLVFPSGLTTYNDKIYMSYGEGDERVKIAEFTHKEIDFMLKKDDFKYVFLNEEYFGKKVILHTGYFNEWNCGDDAFVLVFKYLNKLFPKYKAVFNNKYDNYKNYNLKVLGGGDVVNEYFLKDIHDDDNVVAFGIGVPYISLINNLKKFKYSYMRNRLDYDKYNKEYDMKYLPDLAWLLPEIIKTEKYVASEKIKIGISLPRTYYNYNYERLYFNLLKELSIFINKLDKNIYEIHLIPFGINDKNTNENDIILNTQINKLCPNTINHIVEQNDEYVETIYNLVNQMDFMINGRFHAHIFSCILGKPFVSLSCSRKCHQLMNEYDIDENLYKFETNDVILPVNFSGIKFYDWFMHKMNDKKNIENKIKKIQNKYINLSSLIIMHWKNIVDKYC